MDLLFFLPKRSPTLLAEGSLAQNESQESRSQFCLFSFFSLFLSTITIHVLSSTLVVVVHYEFVLWFLCLFFLHSFQRSKSPIGCKEGETDVRRKSFQQSVSAAADYVSDPNSLSRKSASSIKETRAPNGKKVVSLALSVDAYKKILDRKKANRKSVRGEGDLVTTLAPIASTLKINKHESAAAAATLTAPSSLSATPISPRRSLIIRDRGEVCTATNSFRWAFTFMFGCL